MPKSNDEIHLSRPISDENRRTAHSVGRTKQSSPDSEVPNSTQCQSRRKAINFRRKRAAFEQEEVFLAI